MRSILTLLVSAAIYLLFTNEAQEQCSPITVTGPSSPVCAGTSFQLSPSTGGTWAFVNGVNPGVTLTPSGLFSVLPGVSLGMTYPVIFTETSTGCTSPVVNMPTVGG